MEGEDSPTTGQSDPEQKPSSDDVKRDSNVTPTYNGNEDDSEEELPFPGFVPKVFGCLEQTNRVRFWCLRTITWPYPFDSVLLTNLIRYLIHIHMFPNHIDGLV